MSPNLKLKTPMSCCRLVLLALGLLAQIRAADDPADLDLRAWLQPAPLTAQYSEPDNYVWCGTMVKDDAGKCHLFYSRWPRKLGFDAWVTHSEIAHAVSDNPFGPYHPVDVALPPRGKEYWDGLCTHDPTVMRFGSKYYLYYLGNTAEHPLGDSPTMVEMKEKRWLLRCSQRFSFISAMVGESPSGCSAVLPR